MARVVTVQEQLGKWWCAAHRETGMDEPCCPEARAIAVLRPAVVVKAYR